MGQPEPDARCALAYDRPGQLAEVQVSRPTPASGQATTEWRIMTTQAQASGPAAANSGAGRSVPSRRRRGTSPRRSYCTSSRGGRRRFPASRASQVPNNCPAGNPPVTGLATPPWSIVRSTRIQSIDKLRPGGVTGA